MYTQTEHLDATLNLGVYFIQTWKDLRASYAVKIGELARLLIANFFHSISYFELGAKNFDCTLPDVFMQIFMDMAVLVDAQGDLLDNIESQVM